MPRFDRLIDREDLRPPNSTLSQTHLAEPNSGCPHRPPSLPPPQTVIESECLVLSGDSVAVFAAQAFRWLGCMGRCKLLVYIRSMILS